MHSLVKIYIEHPKVYITLQLYQETTIINLAVLLASQTISTAIHPQKPSTSQSPSNQSSLAAVFQR